MAVPTLPWQNHKVLSGQQGVSLHFNLTYTNKTI